MLPELSRDEILRYSRHLLIPEVGLDGQRKLKKAAVLVVGTGGLGSPVSLYLAAAGIGRLGIIDYDVVDSSNLQRQVLHGTGRVGQPKVESARQRLADLNPYIQIDAYNDIFTSNNAMEIAQGYDIIVDGTDNFPTRYLINDLCVFTGKPYVYGSIYRFEGQVSVFDARVGPCYRCLFPEPPPPGLAPTCGDGGVFGVLPGTIGTIQASEVIKIILGIGTPLIGQLILYDALDVSMQSIHLRKNPHCKVCRADPEITHLIDYEQFCGVPAHDHTATDSHSYDIEPRALADALSVDKSIRLLDVREPHEQQISHLPGALNIPLGELAGRLAELGKDDEIIAFCRTGSRSNRAVEILLAAGFKHALNLRGGMNAWVREIQPEQYQY